MTNNEIVDYIKKSFELKNQGFHKPAIEMLYKALALDPKNIEILVQLAYIYKLLANNEKAIYYVEKVLDINPSHLDSMFLLQEIYLSKNDLNKAKAISKKIYDVQKTPTNLTKIINILNKLENHEEIEKILDSNINLNDECYFEIACSFYKNFNNEKAIELLKSALDANKNNQDALLLLGKIYYESNRIEDAKNIFINIEDSAKSPEVSNYLGLFKLSDQNFLEAIDYFTIAQKADEKNAEYAYNLASAYFLNGWLDEALKYFNIAICLDGENINYHFSLAYLYYQKKDYDKAKFELDFINTLEQNHQLANVLNALILAKNGDLLTAKENLENIIKYNTADEFTYSAISHVYKDLSLVDKAKDAIIKAIELNPKSLEHKSILLDINMEQKDYDNALTLINSILEINENYIYALVNLAKINLEKGEYESLFDNAQSIIELDSNCPQGYYYNAIALFNQGDKDFAIESLKKSISVDINNAALYAKMSEFYQDMNDLKTALEWAKEASMIDDRNYNYKWLCAKLASAMHNETEATKFYSQSYRIAAFDNDLRTDYADYLKSIGKEKQAKTILKA